VGPIIYVFQPQVNKSKRDLLLLNTDHSCMVYMHRHSMRPLNFLLSKITLSLLHLSPLSSIFLLFSSLCLSLYCFYLSASSPPKLSFSYQFFFQLLDLIFIFFCKQIIQHPKYYPFPTQIPFINSKSYTRFASFFYSSWVSMLHNSKIVDNMLYNWRHLQGNLFFLITHFKNFM